MLRHVMLVALGGAIGAVCRYLIGFGLQHRWPSSFPVGTLVVNVMGCLFIGVLGQANFAAALSPTMRLLIGTGLLGSLTTFSTFGYETLRCFDEQGLRVAVTNVVANLLLGFIAVWCGFQLGRLIWVGLKP